jgi:hypothetical protein
MALLYPARAAGPGLGGFGAQLIFFRGGNIILVDGGAQVWGSVCVYRKCACFAVSVRLADGGYVGVCYL